MLKTHAETTPQQPVFRGGLDQKTLYISLLEQALAFSKKLEFFATNA
jgi:hypothetical protein